MYKAVLDHRGLRVQPRDLFAVRLVARDAMTAVSDQLLDQLGARRLVLDQHDIGVEQSLQFATRALERRIFQPPAEHAEQEEVLAFDPPSRADAEIAELGRLVGGVPALHAALETLRLFILAIALEPPCEALTHRWSKPDSNPPSRSRGGSFTLRPVHADGIASVPVQRGLTHLIKDAYAHGRRLRHLNDRAGVPLIEKIDERAARCVTLLADLPTGCQRALADLVVVHRPA